MTPEQIVRNPAARLASAARAEELLLARIERQERIETVLFRVILVTLAIGGIALIIWRNADGGWGAFGTDSFLIAFYLVAIVTVWRNDAWSS